MERGDVVTSVAGAPIRSAREFYEVLEHATDGEELELVAVASGGERRLRARCEAIPDAVLAEMTSRLLGLSLRAAAQGAGWWWRRSSREAGPSGSASSPGTASSASTAGRSTARRRCAGWPWSSAAAPAPSSWFSAGAVGTM